MQMDLYIRNVIAYDKDGIWHSTHVLEFRNGKVAHETIYFGQPFAAASWRSQWADKS
jgi:hypothetical protein